MILGFTGTRRGMTTAQKVALRSAIAGATTLVHGDCLGADDEAAAIAAEVGIPCVSRPSDIDAGEQP